MKITGENINLVKYISSLADGGTHAYPDSVVKESILAYMMSKEADPVITSFDNTTDSFEALSDAIAAIAVATVVGRIQIKATTIDLHQAAGAKDLFTGTTQDVLIKSLTFRTSENISDDAGAITGISIQTDDTTPQVFVNSVVGAKAYLTAQAQLGWTGVSLLKVGKKIQLTLIGASAEIDPTTCDVVCEFEAVVSGGNLG